MIYTRRLPSRSRRCFALRGFHVACGNPHAVPAPSCAFCAPPVTTFSPTDLVDYGNPTHFYRHDFLMERMPTGYECILTNPPFKLVEEFVAHAIEICPLVIMLLRLAFYESERRRDLLENCGLARIHCFRKRLPMMHRAGWEGRKANSGMAFAWYTWIRGHTRPTTIARISWETERNGGAQEPRRTRSLRPRGARVADLFSYRQDGSCDMPDIPPFLRRVP